MVLLAPEFIEVQVFQLVAKELLKHLLEPLSIDYNRIVEVIFEKNLPILAVSVLCL